MSVFFKLTYTALMSLLLNARYFSKLSFGAVYIYIYFHFFIESVYSA